MHLWTCSCAWVYVAEYCSMLQYAAVCCHLWRCVLLLPSGIILQCVAVHYSALQHVAVCGSALSHLQRCVLLLRLRIRLEKLFCRLLLLVPVYGAMLIPSRNNISWRQEVCSLFAFSLVRNYCTGCRNASTPARARHRRARMHGRARYTSSCTHRRVHAHTHVHALGVTY